MITTYAPLMFCGRYAIDYTMQRLSKYGLTFRGALDGLYAEFSKLSTDEFIRGEFWRRVVITTSWNIVVLLLSIVTPNITIAIELLGMRYTTMNNDF